MDITLACSFDHCGRKICLCVTMGSREQGREVEEMTGHVSANGSV